MKFFNKLPKTTFTTTIGDFQISDFFTYLDTTMADLDTNKISVDDRTTLLEASANLYNDANNFWTFIVSNKTINPFDLLAPNTFLFSQQTSDKINFTLFSSPGAVTGGSAFPVGSIITPTIGNTGASYQFGYTGNFNVNGSFAIIEQTSYYDGNMVIGTQYGGTGPFITVGASSENVTVLQKNSDGSFAWAGTFYTGNKKAYSEKVVSQISTLNANQIYSDNVASNPTLDSYLPSSAPVAGATTLSPITAIQNNTNKSKQIEAFVTSQLGLLQTMFVTTKYN
jgi:hypothetical protein